MRFMQKTKKIKTLVKISLLSAACALGLGGNLAGMESTTQAAPKNPSVKEGKMVWNCVEYGTYNNEPVKWRVLNKTGDTLLLLADKAVTSMAYQYNTSAGVSWANSDIKQWLNSSFLNSSFNKEQMKPKDGDYVFLLSSEDLKDSYGFNSLEAKCVQNSEEESVEWWLKDSYKFGTSVMAATIRSNGEDSATPVTSSCFVRPAIQITTNASYTPAGTVNSEYEYSENESTDVIPYLYQFDPTTAVVNEEPENGIPATDEGIILYANGLKYSNDENYKTYTMYTNITGSYQHWLDNGKLKSLTGKALIAITDGTEPEVQEHKNGFTSESKESMKTASKIASASIKDGVITITAKSVPGTVTLWVVDSGNPERKTNCTITVRPTPSLVFPYDKEQEDYDSEAKKYSKAEINVGESTDVYVCPIYKQNNEYLKIESAEQELTYEASVNNDYFEVNPGNSAEKFVIKANGLKSSGSKFTKATGTLTIKCKQNGKKMTVSLTAVNKVKDFTITDPTESLTFDSTKNAFSLTPTDLAADATKTSAILSGTVKLNTVLASDASDALKAKNYPTTDGVKIYALENATGYDTDTFETFGSVKGIKGQSSAQKKITASLSSDKKIITIKALAGTPVNTTSYFLLVYNNTSEDNEKGYLVFSVTAAPKAAESTDSGTTGGDSTGGDGN